MQWRKWNDTSEPVFEKFRKILALLRRKIVNMYFNVAMSRQKLCCKTSIPIPLNTFQKAKRLLTFES